MTKFIDSKGVRIAYEMWGAGDPVVLVMGFATPRQAWAAQIPALAERYKVIALDNRNVGESAVAPACTMKLMADDVIAVMDAEGVSTAHVVGLSMGGMISQHVALEYAGRVRKLALCTTTCGGPHSVQPSPEVFAALMSLSQTTGLADPAMLERFGWILFPRDWLVAHAARLAELMAPLLTVPRPTPAAVQGQFMAILAHNTYDRLPQIGHQTLVLHGTDDVLVPPRNANILAERIPNSRLEWIAHSGHGFNFQEVETFNRILLGFLAA